MRRETKQAITWSLGIAAALTALLGSYLAYREYEIHRRQELNNNRIFKERFKIHLESLKNQNNYNFRLYDSIKEQIESYGEERYDEVRGEERRG